MLAVVQGSHNDIQELKGKVAELEALRVGVTHAALGTPGP